MNRRRLTRALIAVALPALLVPTFSSPASAAAKAPAVPKLAQVAKVYPHLKDGSVDVTREKVYAAGKNCHQGKAIKGATARSATYMSAFDPSSLDDLGITGEEPAVIIDAARLPSAKAAKKYLHDGQVDTKNCAGEGGLGGPDSTYTIKKISFKLGAQRWGYQVTWTSEDSTTSANALFVRKGKDVVSVVTMSLEGDTAPSVPKAIDLTRLALKTVG